MRAYSSRTSRRTTRRCNSANNGTHRHQQAVLTWHGFFYALWEEKRKFLSSHRKILEHRAIFIYIKISGSYVTYMDDRRFRNQLSRSWMLEDKLLVLKCKHGSKDAMCRIYEKYKDFLLTLARALVNERAAAEDVVHDVFVSFAQSVEKFQLIGSLRGYLATCVRNRACDIIRARKHESGNPNSAAAITSGLDNPEQRVIEREEIMRLRRAISQLPYEQREVVVLHLRGAMKFREIARLQGVSVSTIHGRYRYGLHKLRSLLNSETKK